MEANCLILCRRALWIDKILSVVLLKWITKTKNGKDLTEQCDQDEVEKQEDSEIINNILNHNNDRSQSWENSKEEEGL
jgi:hypothetical protein